MAQDTLEQSRWAKESVVGSCGGGTRMSRLWKLRQTCMERKRESTLSKAFAST